MMRFILFFCFYLMAVPAFAQINYYSAETAHGAEAKKTPPAADTSMKSAVVTSSTDCFDEIGPVEAKKIRDKSHTPFADCEKRLRALEKERDIIPEPVAETPRNYVRVTEDEASEEPAEKPEKKKK